MLFSHLHNCRNAHQDLKPENILLDADGHDTIKMQIDWWSVGMLLSEMLTEQKEPSGGQAVVLVKGMRSKALNGFSQSTG
ncbi:hypothetical protein D5086_028269 [Populus alba]|uniref:Uncharacterized protein n=1 Tax=Populus alba TaxID=43335 RepID=A0ACC4AY30_POPAL